MKLIPYSMAFFAAVSLPVSSATHSQEKPYRGTPANYMDWIPGEGVSFSQDKRKGLRDRLSGAPANGFQLGYKGESMNANVRYKRLAPNPMQLGQATAELNLFPGFAPTTPIQPEKPYDEVICFHNVNYKNKKAGASLYERASVWLMESVASENKPEKVSAFVSILPNPDPKNDTHWIALENGAEKSVADGIDGHIPWELPAEIEKAYWFKVVDTKSMWSVLPGFDQSGVLFKEMCDPQIAWQEQTPLEFLTHKLFAHVNPHTSLRIQR